ncbi:MAG: hypothetical protein IPK97_14320 [Ahniella sp.]|nr:hypothetical protein [Ahniella sp.]
MLGAWFVVHQGRAQGEQIATALSSLRLMVYVAGAIAFVTGIGIGTVFCRPLDGLGALTGC